MLRALFERELDYLWSRLSRAATDRESLRPLWSRDADPRVGRLVESAAYAFARVKEKLEDDVPEISHALVAGALPEVLRAAPSATIVQLTDPNRARRTIIREPESMRFLSRPMDGGPCVFESTWPVTTAPLSLTSAKIASREAGVQTLTLRVECHPGAALITGVPQSLRFFVDTDNPVHALDVVNELRAATVPPQIRVLDKSQRPVASRSGEGMKVAWTAVDSPFRLYPGPADRFASGTALRAFFGFPEAFGFFDVEGIRSVIDSLKLTPEPSTLEITLRLRNPVGEYGMDARVHMDCVPVVNVFGDVAVLRDVRDIGPCGVLVPSHHPDSEIFHLNGVRLVPTHHSGKDLALRIWERDDASSMTDDDLYARTERRGAVGNGPSTVALSIVRPSGRPGAPHGAIHADLLVSDGTRTEGLLRSEVSLQGDSGTVNITRVTLPQSPMFDQRIPWRSNAFARMPVPRFAEARSLNAFLSIHDTATLRDQAGRETDVTKPGVVSSRCRSVHRVEDGAVEHGDDVELILDEAVFGGPGASWLVGELLARAIAERADFLRYTRTRWVMPDGALRADYGIRQGHRLPPPIG